MSPKKLQSLPLASIITPTRNRQAQLSRLRSDVEQQTYPECEWLIWDDSPLPDEAFSQQDCSRTTYIHSEHRLSVGEKRNRLVERSRGQVIIHFDDDDHYDCRYVQEMIAQLVENDAGLAKLVGYFVYDRRYDRFLYWDQTDETSLQFICKAGEKFTTRDPAVMAQGMAERHRMGFGFSYVYLREAWTLFPFPNCDFGEDLHFALQVHRQYPILFLQDRTGICIHDIHGANLSGCFPQFSLPPFLKQVVFPRAANFFL